MVVVAVAAVAVVVVVVVVGVVVVVVVVVVPVVLVVAATVAATVAVARLQKLRRKHKCMSHIEENVRGREECMETLACVFLSVRLFALNQVGPRLAGHGVV